MPPRRQNRRILRSRSPRGPVLARAVTVARRATLVVMGAQLLVVAALTLVDSYRRRGRTPKQFPTVAPLQAPLGDGTVTTYTFGSDLFDDMLAAIEGAQRQILFETYIWKGDEVGNRFKQALTEAAERGVEVYAIFDGFANIVVAPGFKRFSPLVRVLKYPAYSAGWHFFDPRRYGRDHRKILVIDTEVGFVGGYNVGTAYKTQWRDTHVRVTGPGVWDLKLAFADFWNMQENQKRGRRPLLLDTVADWEPRLRFTATSRTSGAFRSGPCTWRRSAEPTTTSTSRRRTSSPTVTSWRL